MGLPLGRRPPAVKAANCATLKLFRRFRVVGERRHWIVLVVQRDVVDDIALRFGGIWAVHTVDAVFDDGSQFVRKCGVISLHCGHRRGQHKAVPVLVL